MLSVSTIRFEDRFCASRKGGTGGGVGTCTLFGNFFGNNGLISLEKNFRAKFANDVIFNA